MATTITTRNLFADIVLSYNGYATPLNSGRSPYGIVNGAMLIPMTGSFVGAASFAVRAQLAVAAGFAPQIFSSTSPSMARTINKAALDYSSKLRDHLMSPAPLRIVLQAATARTNNH